MGDKIIISKVKLVNIGDAVREKEGSSEQILIDDIPKRIRAIQTGVDTSDATATSEDILLGKTAYVNDVKVVGTIEKYDGSYEGGSTCLCGTPIEVATAEEMDALLVTENIGKVYKYVGTTDDTYTNGELYQVIEEA